MPLLCHSSLGFKLGCWGVVRVFGLMAPPTAKRISQLNADRDRTRAIAAYLKDRRERLERQLGKRSQMDKNTKRMELVRLARMAFKQEPESVQTSYLQMAFKSQGSLATAAVEVQEAVQAAEPDASAMGAVARRRLSGKRKCGDLASSDRVVEPESRSTLLDAPSSDSHVSETAKQRAAPQEKASTMTPAKSVRESGESGSVACAPKRSMPSGGVPAVTSSSASSCCDLFVSLDEVCHSAFAAPPASGKSVKQGVGESGRGTCLFLRSLPSCLPGLTRAAGQADAAEILACATRILQKCPRLLRETLPLHLRQAVLFGLAAKLTANSDKIKIADVWGQFARRDLSTRQQIMALEAQALQAIGCV